MADDRSRPREPDDDAEVIDGVEVIEDVEVVGGRIQDAATAGSGRTHCRPKKIPARAKLRSRTADWPRVRAGVTCNLVAVFVGLLALVLTNFGGPRLQWLGFAVELISSVITIVGGALCLGAPICHGAKTLAIANVVLLGTTVCSELGLMIWLQWQLAPWLLDSMANVRLLLSLGILLTILHIAQVAVFLFFLRAVALCLGEEGLAYDIGRMMKHCGAIFLFLVLLVPLLMVMLGCIALAFLIGGLVGALACYIWYIIVLFQVRTAIPHGDG